MKNTKSEMYDYLTEILDTFTHKVSVHSSSKIWANLASKLPRSYYRNQNIFLIQNSKIDFWCYFQNCWTSDIKVISPKLWQSVSNWKLCISLTYWYWLFWMIDKGVQTAILVRCSAAQRTTEMLADQRTGKNSGPAPADYRNWTSASLLLNYFR